jgi:RNA polymerase sigma-70 factor, ECF subfamily
MARTEGDYSWVVENHYGDVYRFALSLTHDEAEAADLTQEAFWKLADRFLEIRDIRRMKSWLFTTLHREFLGRRKRQNRFPHVHLEETELQLPAISSVSEVTVDGQTALEALAEVEEVFRAPLALFYLEDYSYAEIGEILGIPIGTVMSRLSRGKARLQQLLADRPLPSQTARLIPFPSKAA